MSAPHSGPPKRSVIKRGFAIVALLVALVILASLGTWQANRYLKKRDIFARMDDRMPLEVVPIDSASDLHSELDFRRVRLEGGQFDLEKTAIIPRRFYKHLPGTWVLAPYRFADGSVVIVQRGWVPEDNEQEARTAPSQDAAIVGLVHLPMERPDVAAREYLAAGTFDLTAMPQLADLDAGLLYDALAAPRPSADFIVLLGKDYAEATDVKYPTPTDEHLTSPYLTPMVHFGYAFLWYGSAILLIWLFWAGWTGKLSPGRPHRKTVPGSKDS